MDGVASARNVAVSFIRETLARLLDILDISAVCIVISDHSNEMVWRRGIYNGTYIVHHGMLTVGLELVCHISFACFSVMLQSAYLTRE